ncbi:hypothetical protein BJV85_003001 [Clostridium acetobutylicum]|uniref:Uncharacterized protein n=1 Tax=Clostridium acetobutylicum (strain ATCC 824 / DSM 792 / JCM 1419 / IAM 19013 / LMG 5710 / NBRC 13948 / NRRL B-527 / VKM B-1787 / 2291 / W) TaxID=272562 RepID=Q97KB4_CLOAB|nr:MULTISPECIES: hypothetical protein [Clostridium]AAK78981.1 Uncharacterized protein similar to Cylindrotheca fusiformis plasmid hypothetical protein (GI:99319) [Clostridium acetobutylicum ATCC 824]ADZ20055.1 Conserved hypothetical protein [Clostridium acetobutylicum EA 2018]AEI31547.1 hypothetical protein SMB_G1022 [Clostridium acetobutylicum DSM 1731]AWV81763.1 hypothetical protein DK921_17040 [Clostridium acetobutylicum]KHD35620.1 hypothetical protein NL50_12775 [Clostridium acetobutylicum
MIVKKISFATPLETLKDIKDDNIDVFVELEDGYSYTIVVATEQNLITQMNNSKKDFIEAGCPFVIVKELRKNIIKDAVQSYAEGNAYWLKLNHLSAEFDISVLDKMIEKMNKDND